MVEYAVSIDGAAMRWRPGLAATPLSTSAIDNQAYGYVVTVSGADDSSLAIERVHVKYRLGAGG